MWPTLLRFRLQNDRSVLHSGCEFTAISDETTNLQHVLHEVSFFNERLLHLED